MDVNKESHFFETASIFEENWIERNTVNALRNHATGVGMGVLVQMDEVKSFSWANSPSMDMPFSEKAQGLRASPNGYPAIVMKSDVQMNERVNIFNESGKGYWMEGCGCLRAEGENRPSRPCHVVLSVQMDKRVIALEGNGSRPSHQGGGVQRRREDVHLEHD